MDTAIRADRPAHALVVDDDDLVRTLATRVLELAGLRVTAVADARDALVRLTAGPADVDLVLTDVEMPGALDGLALAADLGTLAPWLPVIVMSSSDEALGRARILLGVVGVLAKPFAPQVLAELAWSALKPPASARGGHAGFGRPGATGASRSALGRTVAGCATVAT
ncbi:MAG: response regulator [Chloroflexota bacterium]